MTTTRRSSLIGSSPRLRGTPAKRSNEGRHCRFIPAPAGNTVVGWRFGRTQSVHPRACGEHSSWPSSLFCESGSSPRLRGTLVWKVVCFAWTRFIPAPAGNTSKEPPESPSLAVHPRACGEHGGRGAPAGDPHGSSPRLRGTRGDEAAAMALNRFIPAPAGNTET